jgi:WD40 repeat protein
MVKGSVIKGMTVLAAVALALLAACGRAAPNKGAVGPVEIRDVHGLGFTSDGRQLAVAAHDGLVVFTEQGWQVPDGPKHDYMGFVATSDGFYSSGHPNPSSRLKNPFGLIKSSDWGKTLVKLGFEGESDFHVMGVGYENHAIYLFSPAPNSKLSPGVHSSLDDGKTWKQAAMQGLTGNLINIAVHPIDPNVVAVATEAGLFLSSDRGGTFNQIAQGSPVSAVAFSPKGDQLLFGLNQVLVYDINGKQVQALQTPAVGEKDAIGYIAVNPASPNQIAFATFARDVHVSRDSGKSWQQIADDGKGI